MDRYYRENYAFEGRIIAEGYPRDDSLVAPGHEQRREATRERLGIAAAPAGRALRAHLARRPRHQLPSRPRPAAPRRGRGRPCAGTRLRDPAARPPLPRAAPLRRARRRRHGLPRDQRPDPRLRRRGARLLLAAVRLRAHRAGRWSSWCPTSATTPSRPAASSTTSRARPRGRCSTPPPRSSAPWPTCPRLEQAWQGRLAEFNGYYNRLADGRAAQRVVAEFFEPLLKD